MTKRAKTKSRVISKLEKIKRKAKKKRLKAKRKARKQALALEKQISEDECDFDFDNSGKALCSTSEDDSDWPQG